MHYGFKAAYGFTLFFMLYGVPYGTRRRYFFFFPPLPLAPLPFFPVGAISALSTAHTASRSKPSLLRVHTGRGPPMGSSTGWAPASNSRIACVENKVAQTSASWLSRCSSQRHLVPRAAPSFGQARPISRLGGSVRPYRAWFRHSGFAVATPSRDLTRRARCNGVQLLGSRTCTAAPLRGSKVSADSKPPP